MKANEFVKKFGVSITRYWIKEFTEINKLPDEMLNIEYINDLKRIVNSHELVEPYKGLHCAKNTLGLLQSSMEIGLYHGMDGVDAATEIPRLKQAIADVEACEEVL